MLSLFIPWGLLLLLLVTVIMLIKKKWWLSASIFIILVILNYWSDCFCMGFANSDKGDLKVLSFNMKGKGDYDANKVSSIISLLQEENPDILFLTENNKPLCDSLHERLHLEYPYDTRGMNHNAIYSKYPLRNALFFDLINRGTSYMVKCDAEVNGKEVTLFGCHLSSNNYSRTKDYLTPEEVKSMSGIKAYFANFTHAKHLREMEADTVINHCQNAERVIVMGDMNEVSGAPSMRKFSNAGYKDAWSEGGFGYGATIHHPLPYRIDHVLYKNGLKLKGIKKIDANGISDHDALLAVFDIE